MSESFNPNLSHAKPYRNGGENMSEETDHKCLLPCPHCGKAIEVWASEVIIDVREYKVEKAREVKTE